MPDATGRKALDLWQAPPDAGDALVCVATSFTFDSVFFETECIGRFLSMNTHPSESEAVGYLIEREEKLAGARVCALIDRRHARGKESLRWDVLGVLLPSGIQHSKISLLVWGNHVRVIIGSGNLTEPGYRSNLEVFGVLDLSLKEGGPRNRIEEVIRFLEEVAANAVGEGGGSTPKERVLLALDSVRQQISAWPDEESTRFLPVLASPGKGILQQLRQIWPNSGPPRTASVVSPFFDKPGHKEHAVDELVAVLAKTRPRTINFYVRSTELPDGRTRVYAPKDLLLKAKGTCEVHIYSVSLVQEKEIRQLHAKMLRIENDQWQLLLIGSSNFTSAGIAGRGNFEADLAYLAKDSDSSFKPLQRTWPETDEVELDLASPKFVWDPEPEELEGGAETVPLPSSFQDAIFFPGEESHLEIALGANLPSSWSIRVPNGIELLASKRGEGQGKHMLPWPSQPAPFILEVFWADRDRSYVASWPVNVSNPAALPPPDALRGLSLEELLEILSSVRPLSDAVVQVIKNRSSKSPTNIELDPLRRYDSQAFLLRRTKRVAAALERLRERLERPALTKEAFEWRLNGAIGPMALADAFVREANIPGEARFYLAELALSLSRVKAARAAAGGLSYQMISRLLKSSIGDLENRAKNIPSSPETTMLEQYTAAAFKEALGQ